MRNRHIEETETDLMLEVPLRVRFSETDGIGVVWHGEYLRYFEDGREAFGERYGIPYLKVFEEGYTIPIVDVESHYCHSLKAGDRGTIEIRYVDTPAAKIRFEYKVWREPDHVLCATGSTTQVFINKTGELEITQPAFYEEWKKRMGLPA